MVDVRDLERAIPVTRRLPAQLIEKLLHLVGGAPALPFLEPLIMRAAGDIRAESLITRRRQRAGFTYLVEFGPDGKARRLAGVLVFFVDQFLHQLARLLRQPVTAVAGKFLLRQEPGVAALVDGLGQTHTGFPSAQSARAYSHPLIPAAGAISRKDGVTAIG